MFLYTPDTIFDLNELRVIYFSGESKAVSRLDGGPVEVLNLIGDRSRVKIEMAILAETDVARPLYKGTHIIFSPSSGVDVELATYNNGVGGVTFCVQNLHWHILPDHGVRFEILGDVRMDMKCMRGPYVVVSIITSKKEDRN